MFCANVFSKKKLTWIEVPIATECCFFSCNFFSRYNHCSSLYFSSICLKATYHNSLFNYGQNKYLRVSNFSLAGKWTMEFFHFWRRGVGVGKKYKLPTLNSLKNLSFYVKIYTYKNKKNYIKYFEFSHLLPQSIKSVRKIGSWIYLMNKNNNIQWNDTFLDCHKI